MTQESKTPLVSIILPTYNRANFLINTVEHILSQTFTDFELLIIDDGSSDQTKQVVTKLAMSDTRIKYIRNEINLKIILSLNRGIGEAKGMYIARADDDDPWIDVKKLEKQIYFLQTHKEYALVGTGAIAVDENGKELFKYLEPEQDANIRSVMLFKNPFIHGTVVFRTSILKKTGLYDENFKDVEDWDLWMRMGLHSKLHNLPLYGIYRFYGPRGLSIKNRPNMSRTRLLLIKKYRKNYPNYTPAFLFNMLQRIYSLFPYVPHIDNFLLKLKMKSFGKERVL